MEHTYKKFAVVLVLLSSLLFSGCGGGQPQYAVDLEVWSLYDDSTIYTPLFTEYKKLNPHVGNIKYRKFTPETYRRDLLEAFASGQGPDVFLLHNSWVPSFANKIEPAPKAVTSLQEMQANFPEVVMSDFSDSANIYGYPVSVDSLVLYYNKDMFNAAGIAQYPKTWDEFAVDAKKMTVVNSGGNIVQAGAALGSGSNVNRSTDILSMLMMQNGAEMTDETHSSATFDRGIASNDGKTINSGENALDFYTQFAKLSSPLYTWNLRQKNSVEAFTNASAAMMFNYSWQIQNIKAANPKLNYGVVSVPQLHPEKPVNYANYFAYAVSKNKVSSPVSGQQAAVPNAVRVHEAWQLVRFLTVKNGNSLHLTNAISKNAVDLPLTIDPALEYLKLTNRPAARRDLIDQQKTDPVLGAFASGNLIARTWFQPDPDAVDQIFSEMIDSVNRGDIQLHQALSLASNRVNALLQNYSKPQ